MRSILIYLETRKKLNAAKRRLGFNSYKDNDFIYKYLKEYQRLNLSPKKGQKRPRATDFIKNNPNGTYILNMAHHLACIKNGKLLDTWNSSDRVIYTAWLIKEG